jgi:aminoglycoside phosphotransferase (APT) family kinase protein
MAPIDLAELPPALVEHVSPRALLTFPPQGMTSDVAFAADAGRVVVVKRCAHRIYLDWLRREHVVLRALADSGLPIPRLIAYTEAETSAGQTVGWLLMSHVAGSRLFDAAIEAPPSARQAMFRGLGELVRRLHETRVPLQLQQSGSWLSMQIERARNNLPWCDGTAADLAQLERSRPAGVPETLIHGDLDLANVLIDERGELGLIDWAGGGSGDPRHDIALALDDAPELEMSRELLNAFFAGYGTAAVNEATRDWFVRLYNYF